MISDIISRHDADIAFPTYTMHLPDLTGQNLPQATSKQST